MQILTHIQVGLVGGNPGSELGAQSEGRLLQHFDFELKSVDYDVSIYVFVYIHSSLRNRKARKPLQMSNPGSRYGTPA